MTSWVRITKSAEDDVNLRVSTVLSAAIDEGRRRRRQSLRAIRLFVLQTTKRNVYTDNHSGISARQRDSKVSMTDLVSAEDDVNLRV